MDADSDSNNKVGTFASGSALSEADGDDSATSTPPYFTELPIEIQLRVVDFLDLVSLDRVKATCSSVRALPIQNQHRTALMEFDQEMKRAHQLISRLSFIGREEIRIDHKRVIAWNIDWSQGNRRIFTGTGKFHQWVRRARENYISSLHACQAVSARFEVFCCFDCLRYKPTDNFDVTQLGSDILTFDIQGDHRRFGTRSC